MIPLRSSFSSLISELSHRSLRKGDVLSQARVFSEDDVAEYAKVSRDSNPVHFDSHIARALGFDDRLVHGFLVASLFPLIISSQFPGSVYVSQSLNFKAPVYIGDEVTGRVEVTHLKEIKGKIIAKFLTKCSKNNVVAIEGQALAILPSSPKSV